MPSLRTLGALPVSATQANVIRWAYFVRVDLPQPIGTKRFTDYPDLTNNAFAFDVGDGAGSQSWDGSMPFVVGRLDQSTHDPRTVSDIQFGNLDTPPSWTTWSNTLAASGLSLRNARCRIWAGWFNTATGLPYATPPNFYDGIFDNHTLGNYAKFALVPDSNWTRQSPWSVPGPLCPSAYMDGETCQALVPMPGVTAALKFPTVGANVDVGTFGGLKPTGDYALAAWLYVLDDTAQGTIYGNFDFLGGTLSKGVAFRYVGNAGAVTGAISLRSVQGDGAGFSQKDSALVAAAMIRPRTWTHVAMSYANASKVVTFFINGVSVGTNTHTRSPVQSAGTVHTFLGADGGALTGMTGALSELRYYGSQLTADQVYAIYVNNAPPNPSSYWKCNEGTGTTITDTSGAGLNGTASGTAWIAEPSGELTCGHTRKNCTDRGNQTHFGGNDLLPKPGESIYWATKASAPKGGS